jgi:hypothetical protein
MEKIPTAVFATELIALRSLCIYGQGRVSELIVGDDKPLYDPRRVRSLVGALARHYAVDLVALRQRCGRLLHGRNYLPLPFSSGLVLVPLPLGQGPEKMGYINLLAVQGVFAWASGSKVKAGADTVLECWLSPGSVRHRLLRAQLVLRELDAGGLLPQMDSERLWRQKLEIIRALLAEV